jgi:hypothetical protein
MVLTYKVVKTLEKSCKSLNIKGIKSLDRNTITLVLSD